MIVGIKMTLKFDHSYFQTRIRINQALAERSALPSVRDIHRQYVRFYQALLDSKG